MTLDAGNLRLVRNVADDGMRIVEVMRLVCEAHLSPTTRECLLVELGRLLAMVTNPPMVFDPGASTEAA